MLATTVGPEVCAAAPLLPVYQEQNSTVEPGLRWIKHPAAITPVWLEQPERSAALAMLTGVGLLGSALIQRQVRLSLQRQRQFLPGNKGLTATLTAAVVLSLFAPVAIGQLVVEDREVLQVYGLQDHHRLVCAALGLARAGYAAPSGRQNCPVNVIPP